MGGAQRMGDRPSLGGRHVVASSPPTGRPQIILKNTKNKIQLSGSDIEDFTNKARGDKIYTTLSNTKDKSRDIKENKIGMEDLRQEEGTQVDMLNREEGNNMHT